MSHTYQGVNATQLVFTPRIHRADHMRIKRAAAVYLDTWPFNGHSTSVEALCVLFFFFFFLEMWPFIRPSTSVEGCAYC